MNITDFLGAAGIDFGAFSTWVYTCSSLISSFNFRVLVLYLFKGVLDWFR